MCFQKSYCIDEYVKRSLIVEMTLWCCAIDCVPQAEQVACHHGDAQTNKPTKRDGKVSPLIFPLHNTDKASAGPAIG